MCESLVNSQVECKILLMPIDYLSRLNHLASSHSARNVMQEGGYIQKLSRSARSIMIL